jgi:hypothetical protein
MPAVRSERSMRGLGYIPDLPDNRDWLVAAHPRIGSASVLAEIDLRSFADPADNQLGASACVGFALAAGIDIRGRIQGLDLRRSSRVAPYTMARADQKPLRDEGCRPRDAINGIRHWGVIPEELAPFNEATINQPLKWGQLQHAMDSRDVKTWRIDSSGPNRCDVVYQTLSSGIVVAMAIVVDRAVDEYRAGQVIGPARGADRGGHYVLCVGFRAADGAFLLRNSWGRQYGEDGYMWLSPERVGSLSTTDLWAIEAAPKGLM